jgi:N-acetylmuramoyl-L-alanine amidase
VTLTDGDILIGALTVYGEARGDTQEGKVALAHTILNRANAKKWWGKGNGEDIQDHTVKAVCFKDKQFSCWNLTDPNEKTLLKMYRAGLSHSITDKSFRACLKALIDAVDGFAVDHTKGATHYLTTSLHQSGKAPEWSKRGDYIEIGAHRFFRGVE